MIKAPSLRFCYFLAFLICSALLLYSIYLQLNVGLQPCPLCVLQRLSFILVAFVFLLGSIIRLRKIGQIIIGALACLSSLMGVIFSVRQIWLQHSPSHASDTCGTSIEYMLQVLPFDQVLKNIFQGSAECTQVGWEFFYLSLAEWSFVFFVIFLFFSLWQSFRKMPRRQDRIKGKK